LNREAFLRATNNDSIDTAGTVEATVVATAVEAPNPAPRNGATLDPTAQIWQRVRKYDYQPNT
jgi:hypothetical protein